MTRLLPAALAALSLLAAAPAEAKCQKGHVSDGGGMCLPCPDKSYVKGNTCAQCPAGYEPNKALTGCAKAKPQPKRKCETGHVDSGGMCLPCPEDTYVKGAACKQCPKGQEPNKARTGCVKTKAPAPRKCPAGHVDSAGMCMPCPNDNYVKGNSCKHCPKGQEPNKLRTGCAKTKAPPPHKCPAGKVAYQGSCMDCDANQIVKAGKCKTCPAGTKPNAARTVCAKHK
jgi:hypothetical protein